MAEIGSSDLSKPVLAFLICRVRLYCDVVADRLAHEPGIALIGIANPEDNLVAEIETVVPDVVLLDTSPTGCACDGGALDKRATADAHPRVWRVRCPGGRRCLR